MSRDDFMILIPAEFQSIYNHYIESETQRREEQYRTSWEVARWEVFRTLCPPDKKQISPTDLIEFPWEKEERQKLESTEEKYRQAIKFFQGR